MSTLIGYDITDTDKGVNQATPQPVYFDSEAKQITCEAYDYCFDIAKGETHESVEGFIDQATKEGWFKKK